LIEASALKDGVKARAIDIFSRIAKAEATVHGVAEDAVAFHEVGALDSIVDIVGAAVCLDLLAPERITAGAIELGGGVVHCAHGILPVPAPATLLLCAGLPVTSGNFDKEMTTPTGAAILASCVDEFVTAATFTEIKTGYGIGMRQFERPNILRVSWRQTDETGGATYPTRQLTEIVTNIDDMTGEELGFLMEQLFAAGALDVTITPCVMKKSRPAHIVSVLAVPDTLDALHRALVTHSSTLGFRERTVRCVALRREERVRPDGLREKTAFLDGKPIRTKVEFEDRARIAREKGCSLREVAP
jgi:uncharacterized protein (TIGR00299 family) protein